MAKESGYFEETGQLHFDEDLFVSKAAWLLHRQMANQYLESGTVPLPGFNILYFMQSTIRAWQGCDPTLRLSSKSFPYPCEPIKAVNWPREWLDQPTPETPPLVARYLELVGEDSDPAGDEFDVAYAVRTLMATLSVADVSRTAQQWCIQPIISLDTEPGPEEWAAGFVCSDLSDAKTPRRKRRKRLS